ncbi:MAG: hypothetical protein KF687_18010 [Cyclobacteriaceae bacterium]|nr:hypothetical protein [Cyclobacteriaceae bacterium]
MKLLLTLFISILSISAFAQAKQPTPAPSQDCFRDWFSLFNERGANPVADGTHDVIITLRHGSYSECFMGRIAVSGGKLTGKLEVQKVDGSYQEFDKKVSFAFQNAEGTLKEEMREVSNGMSASASLTDGELIRLFFYKSLADKPKANKKAPAPSALIKN